MFVESIVKTILRVDDEVDLSKLFLSIRKHFLNIISHLTVVLHCGELKLLVVVHLTRNKRVNYVDCSWIC